MMERKSVCKSVERVRTCLAENGVLANIVKSGTSTRTAAQAAREVGCELNQIVKSMVYAGIGSGQIYLFLTAGGRQVSDARAARLAGEDLQMANPIQVRQETGFSIGGVAPIAHPSHIHKFIDCTLLQYPEVWAAAGSPNHLFSISPNDLLMVFGAVPAEFSE